MESYNYNDDKREKAQKQVDELKGFYIHFAVYITINAFILINIYLNTDDFWQWGHFFTLFFWGVGVAFHAMNVFKVNPLFSKSWEDRQIKKYMDRDRDNSKKYF